jgi:hypothetical protein
VDPIGHPTPSPQNRRAMGATVLCSLIKQMPNLYGASRFVPPLTGLIRIFICSQMLAGWLTNAAALRRSD